MQRRLLFLFYYICADVFFENNSLHGGAVRDWLFVDGVQEDLHRPKTIFLKKLRLNRCMAMGLERPQAMKNFFSMFLFRIPQKWFMIQRNSACLNKDLLIACFVADKKLWQLEILSTSVECMHQRTQRLLLHDHRPISEWSLACLC